MKVAEDILPIGEFKSRVSELVRKLRGRQRPLVITQNGKPAAVVMSPQEFDRLSYQARYVHAIQEGIADIERGETISDAELGLELDERFGKLSKPRKR